MFKWLFGTTNSSVPAYELVEYKIDDTDEYRQGIRLLDPVYNGVVVTIDPKVKLEEVDNAIKIKFDFFVEANPNNVLVEYRPLHAHLGPIIGDLISKDYNA